MLFPTIDYFLFLPLIAVAHWRIGGSWRTPLLLVASAVFYAAWNPVDSLVLGWLVVAAFLGGPWVAQVPASGTRLAVACAAVLGPLVFYKYVAFVGENLHALVPQSPAPPRQHLPIGISFYSFQALAYVLDCRRGQPTESSPIRFATFLLFFPHLVAGPILRAGTLLAQLREPRALLPEDVGWAVSRLCSGLVKKVLVADVLRVGIVDSVFVDPAQFTASEVLVALYAYTLQIYCDFSGYTDFAVGSARLFGFRIPENFDRPYQALSVASYWRRWHITLSDWVRDYVYYPMGGSRGGGLAAYRNTMVTLLVLGAWHGANWTFIVYGGLHGIAVCVNRWLRKRTPAGTPAPAGWGVAWRWLVTFHFVVLARILFRSDSLAHAGQVAGALAGPAWPWPRFSHHALAVLALAYAWHFTPRAWVPWLRDRVSALPAWSQGLALAATGWACVQLGVGDSLGFIYDAF